MKYWIIRIPDPRPRGDTSFRAIVLAIVSAEPAKVPDGGCVESVVTRRTHLRFCVRFRFCVGRLVAVEAITQDCESK
jgi:hypothetical protein